MSEDASVCRVIAPLIITYSIRCEVNIHKCLRRYDIACTLRTYKTSSSILLKSINLLWKHLSSSIIMAPTIVLITGANRGIGKGLLSLYLLKENHTIIAANRDLDGPSSRTLSDLPKGERTTLILVKIDATVATDASDAVKHLASLGIDHIDVLIANAGIATIYPTVATLKIDDMQKHFETNVYGVVYLYQAFLPVLKKSEKPTWVSIGSSAAFLTVSTFAPLTRTC